MSAGLRVCVLASDCDSESVMKLIKTNDYLQSRSAPVLWEIVVSDVVNTWLLVNELKDAKPQESPCITPTPFPVINID